MCTQIILTFYLYVPIGNIIIHSLYILDYICVSEDNYNTFIVHL